MASMENQTSDILTVDEAAELLKIPRSSVYKLAQEGKLPAQKVGRHWRFHRLTLLGWISGQVSFTEKKKDRGSLDFS
jgi:excisionase family DNA binding protein